MKKQSGKIIYSPSDLVRYVESPYASWMDRYYLENPKVVTPDEETEDQKLIAETGNKHEKEILRELKGAGINIAEVSHDESAEKSTKSEFKAKTKVVYQAALVNERFAGFADFLILDDKGAYEIWDTKLARSPKPYYIIQLCCYSEMYASTTGEPMPEKFGIILGTKEKVEFRVEDFIHYYRRVRDAFLAMQDGFTGDIADCPEPQPGAKHGRWTSHAEKFFDDTDHLVRVAGITVGQIKKLKGAGISTMAALSKASGLTVPKLPKDTLTKLVDQARVQCGTREDRAKDPDAPARYELLQHRGENDEARGLSALPPADAADIFFDMEGYPLVAGGLEYLFGATTVDKDGTPEFHDWWAHDRDEEKKTFEDFVDWTYKRWLANPELHIYHYAAYEVSALRRLSTRHDTRQDEVDDLLRNEVFVDLYQTVRHGLIVGEESYSIKLVERLYRSKRATEVSTAVDSIVQYAHWIGSGQSKEWKDSSILKGIRDYNEDDCKSTVELTGWLRKVAADNGIAPTRTRSSDAVTVSATKELSDEVKRRIDTIQKLREKGDEFAIELANLLDFHRREEKPIWWRMFDRAKATADELRDDTGCIEGIKSVGSPTTEKLSLVQTYEFDPTQECKLVAGDDKTVMFMHNLKVAFKLVALDLSAGTFQLKISNKMLSEKLGGRFPSRGSIIPQEVISTAALQTALTDVGIKHLSDNLTQPITSLLSRTAPAAVLQSDTESAVESTVRITNAMSGDCLVIQGPPGTGKTYTAAQVIKALIADGKKVGITSNSHKAVINLMKACGESVRKDGHQLSGIKVGGDKEDAAELLGDNQSITFISESKDALPSFSSGVVGGTAWLFTRPEWEGKLDFLFVDEAGQVSLANAIAMSRSANNLVLLGDQMQLEQPIQGTHPGDSGMSSLQYTLKDLKTSQEDAPAYHSVVPADYGIFLGETRRMHPDVCQFISDSIYQGRLGSHPDCEKQIVSVPSEAHGRIQKESGVVFVGVEHDGDIQQSDEEVQQVKEIYEELLGRPYTTFDGEKKKLVLGDFLFISPYNAQVRALQNELPAGARVGSVDKFQGQEAVVCILSLCSSYGEYGSRGLAFILDKNRINVAMSRAKSLAIVVADPRIATATAGSIDEMMLLNVFCKLADSGNAKRA